jgi:helicase
MLIADLAIPAPLKQQYGQAGMSELYPPQADCINKGLLSGKNLLVAIPTASGKTLVAEMAMHHHIAEGGKCLYIVPLKALASEKYDEFRGKGVRVGIATGDFDRRDDSLGRNDIVVATSEKVDSLLRNSTRWLGAISLLVVDEVHLIDSPDRGPTLEMVIAKMRYRNPSMQVVALSATIGNPQSLAGWLDAELVTGTWRPVDLLQGVFCDHAIHFHDATHPVKAVSRNYDDINLCLDTIADGGQCLVFVSSRRNAEAFAKRAASAINSETPGLSELAARLAALAGTEMEKVLAGCVAKGAAFHHAGLRREARGLIEGGFRKGLIRCISSTPTLAAGLNLPARRVIIRDYLRYSVEGGMQPIPVREYHQMAGRAGRPHLDPFGEAVLIAKDPGQVEELFEYYIDAPPEEVHSKSADPAALYTHILSLIASGFARTRGELAEFMDRTFYVHEKRKGRLIQRSVDAALAFLVSSEMVVEVGEHLGATEFGMIVSRLYIDPRSADIIVRELRTQKDYTDLGLLHLICCTPDMPTLYVRNADLPVLSRLLEQDQDQLWIQQPQDDDESEMFYRSLKTALLLSDWANEVSEEKICERYSVGPGDIYGMVESVNWLLHAGAELARMFCPQFSPSIREYEVCMKSGIRRELLPLVRLRGIGRVRARRLFNNGIRTPDAILEAGVAEVTRILGRGIAEQIFLQLEGKKGRQADDPGGDPAGTQSSLQQFR